MVFIIVYFFTFSCVQAYKVFKRKKHKVFPHLSLKKDGVVFYSLSVHRIKINERKFVQVGKRVYVKTNNEIIQIVNVDNVYKYQSYLYFTSLGKTKIVSNCINIYKYFNIKIKSNQLNIFNLKQKAILDLINNFFNINFCKITEKYLKIIKKVLNINIFSNKITIKQNKLKIPYEISYKINNKIRKVILNQTLEEI